MKNQSHIIVKFIIVCVLLMSCKAQEKNSLINTKLENIEKFNIKEFKNNKLKLNEVYKEIRNDSVIEIAEFNDSFIKYIKKVNSPFQNRKTYYKTSLSLKAESNYFYMIPVGISKKYDENGNLIKQKNWDEIERRAFSIQQLINKMDNDFNIDLTDESKCGLSTVFDPRYGYYYDIIIQNHHSQNRYRNIQINTTTGETISDSIVSLIK